MIGRSLPDGTFRFGVRADGSRFAEYGGRSVEVLDISSILSRLDRLEKLLAVTACHDLTIEEARQLGVSLPASEAARKMVGLS